MDDEKPPQDENSCMDPTKRERGGRRQVSEAWLSFDDRTNDTRRQLAHTTHASAATYIPRRPDRKRGRHERHHPDVVTADRNEPQQDPSSIFDNWNHPLAVLMADACE